MDDASASATIEMAKDFIHCLQSAAPTFDRAFYRFRSEPSMYGSNASYVVGAEVHLLDPFGNSTFFEHINERARNLLQKLDKERGVILLTVNSTFDYKINFEWNDLERWKITKIDGVSGIPAGL
jgi:hypothetical protein